MLICTSNRSIFAFNGAPVKIEDVYLCHRYKRKSWVNENCKSGAIECANQQPKSKIDKLATIQQVSPIPMKPIPSESGPFGLAKGVDIIHLKEAIPTLRLSSPSPYYFQSVGTVNSNSNFPLYSYTVTGETGLCMVMAVTEDIETNDFGDQLKARYDAVKQQINAKYGSPYFDKDDLTPGSIWKETKDYTRALQKGDRAKLVIWVNGENGLTLPHDIQEIAVIMHAKTYSIGRIDLVYKFNNFDKCQAVIAAADRQNL
jgi:hypothetical protein